MKKHVYVYSLIASEWLWVVSFDPVSPMAQFLGFFPQPSWTELSCHRVCECARVCGVEHRNIYFVCGFPIMSSLVR